MWNLFNVSTVIAFLTNVVLGVLVYAMNPNRRTNRHFLITSLTLAAWLACLLGAVVREKALLMFWIRMANFSCVLLPPAFDLLRAAIVRREEDRRVLLRDIGPWLLLLLFVTIVVRLPAFLIDVTVGPEGFPRPTYGPAQIPYILYWVAALVLLVGRFTRDLRRAEDIQRAELEYTVFAFAVAAGFALLVGQVVPLATGHADIMQLMPFSVILLDALVAYGIVTQRIMSVGDVIRRLAAYALLVGYLLVLYFVVFAGAWAALSGVLREWRTPSHVLATLVVAFSVAPMQGFMQRVARRLFIGWSAMDAADTVRKAHQILISIGTVDELMGRFSELIMATAGTDRLIILLSDGDGYSQVFPVAREGHAQRLASDEALVEMLQTRADPVLRHAILRMRPDAQRTAAAERLESCGCGVAVGIHTSNMMKGILLLGRRLSGRIYGAAEQDALQLLCDQLGVALDNAKLYTEVQDGKIYNDILLDSLVSGIVAANADHVVTVFNREAQRITGLTPDQVVGHPVEVLPTPVAEAIRTTVGSGARVLDRDETIIRDPEQEQSVPIRLSCSVFHSHKGELLGVITVFNDMTLLKKLEEQVRRTDRLSSVGTLAAGMAHEIKNPLVSIKTFTQLLPEQYDDDEFRRTFFSLVGSEVKRIDSLVNRLLKFSRPPKARLVPTHLHVVLGNSLELIQQKLRQRGIVLKSAFDANEDLIRGDPDLLNQAFINFLLNAIEAMDREGELTVATKEVESKWYAARSDVVGQGSRIRVSIKDTGCGISPEDVPKVFDPFFTTKSRGTGLGLSVAHGIIEEHGAGIDVEQNVPVGSIFHLLFPLMEAEEAEG